jgi:hypothetical protein
MLTKKDRDTFRLALASLNCYTITDVSKLDIDDMITDEQIVETAETVEHYFEARGRRLNRKGERPETPYEKNTTLLGDVYKWDDVQSRKGARRGTLYLMDLGNARAVYFDGES